MHAHARGRNRCASKRKPGHPRSGAPAARRLTWRQQLLDALRVKRLLREAGVVRVNEGREPAAVQVQPRAQHVQHVALVHERHGSVSVGAAPDGALQPRRLRQRRVAGLQHHGRAVAAR